jgi:thiamine biosynthesis lipoprotein
MNTKNNRILFIILGALLVIALYFLIPKRPFVVDSGHQLVMGTFARVVVIAADRNTADISTEAAFAEIYKVDELMSRYKSDSQISIVNRDGLKSAVEVSESTYEVLKRSVEISKLTDGAFDITVGPLVDIFRSAEKKEAAPSEEQIAQAKSKIGYEKLNLDDDNKTVRLTVEGMRLDLGGIAKGYAVDKAIEAAQKDGVLGAMVDIGGDICCFGKAPQGKNNWLIGLKNPSTSSDAGEDNILLELKLTNQAVATSGDYQQFVLIKDKRFSHIINRRTGTSAEGLSSVTIIAENATDADALATAVSVMGMGKGLALIEKLPNTEAILITLSPEYKIIKSSGAEKYIK